MNLPPGVTLLPGIHTRAAADRYLVEHFRPGVFVIQLCHDDWCRAIATQRDADCSPGCKPDVYLLDMMVLLGAPDRRN